jgi:hypothetical protein
MRKKGAQEDGKRWQWAMAIEVCFSFNIAVVFDFNLFPFPPSKAKWKGDVLTNRQKAAKSNLVLGFFLFYNAHSLLTYRIILRCQALRGEQKKNPRN